MILPSKYNISVARAAYFLVSSVRKAAGLGDIAIVKRGGINWVLDLREGIDLTIYLTGYFEHRVIEACCRNIGPGHTALDIGANMGSHTLHMARAVGPTGKVVSIEPTRRPFQRMVKNMEANPELHPQVKAIQMLLSATPEQQVPDFLCSSWLVKGHTSGAHPVHCGVPQDTQGAKATTLDDLVEAEGLGHIDLLKIDVDGAEWDVLNGARKTIGTYGPVVVIEIAPYTLEERGLPGDASIRILKEMGYRFEDLAGRKLDQDHRRWCDNIKPGYGRDVVAHRLKCT
jgi:FkbM family methyltransferase